MTSYPETIAYLYSLIDYEKIRIERYTSESHGLARVGRLLEASCAAQLAGEAEP